MNQSSRKPMRIRIAGATVVCTAIGALAGCSTSIADTTDPTPASTEPAPDVQPTLLEGEALTEHFNIPGDATGEELAEIYVNLESEWNLYGVHDGLARDALDNAKGEENWTAYFHDIATTNTQSISLGLFTENALTKPSVQTYIANQTNVNAGSLSLNVKTSPEAQDPYNEVPYDRDVVVEEFKSSTINPDGSETIAFTTKTVTNVDKNIADDLATGEETNGELREVIATFVTEGNDKKIDDFEAHLLQ